MLAVRADAARDRSGVTGDRSHQAAFFQAPSARGPHDVAAKRIPGVTVCAPRAGFTRCRASRCRRESDQDSSSGLRATGILCATDPGSAWPPIGFLRVCFSPRPTSSARSTTTWRVHASFLAVHDADAHRGSNSARSRHTRCRRLTWPLRRLSAADRLDLGDPVFNAGLVVAGGQVLSTSAEIHALPIRNCNIFFPERLPVAYRSI